MTKNETKAESKEDEDLSSLGDASPLDDGETLHAQRVQDCRSQVQKLCSVSFIAIYILVYFSLSSNPKVVMVNSDHQYDVHMAALTGRSHKSSSSSSSSRHMGYHYHNSTATAGFGPTTNATIERMHHVRKKAAEIARVYTPVSPSVWCIDGRLKFEQAKRRPMGLCYVKMPKAASTTLAGINVRIARNFGLRQGLRSCIRHDGPTPGFYYRQRETGLSFLWTFVRHPSSRAMSRVASNAAKKRLDFPSPMAHNTSNKELNQTTEYVLQTLHTSTDIQFGTTSPGQGGFQIQYASLRFIGEHSAWNASEPTKIKNHRRMHKYVGEVLERYDFIGVVERMDESLVALQLLLGLETSDILYFSSRMPDQYLGRIVPGRSEMVCQPFMDPQRLRTTAVDHYLNSGAWWAQNYGDLLLHEAASQSLDRTILKIGLDEFSKAYKAFKSMLQEAHETCQPIFPCSQNGTDQSAKAQDDCYFDDVGCGYPCLDQVGKNKSSLL